LPRVDPAEEEKKAGRPRFPYRPLQGVCARPGSRKLERLDENIGAVAVKLAADDLQEIESALSQITIQGDRYPKEVAKMSGR
jgi:diketogulonate reductase-like aldo/keto reductase